MIVDVNVSTVLTRLALMIERIIQDEVSLLLDADKEVQSLSSKLHTIHEVLADAERKGVTDPRVKKWLNELQEIVYKIDYALDEWEVETIRQKYHKEDGCCKSDKCFQSACFCVKRLMRRRVIARQVKEIIESLDTIAQRNENEFKFIPNVGRDTKVSQPKKETTSFFNINEVHGRGVEKNILVNRLLRKNAGGGDTNHGDGNNALRIISIVGAGGMGKSTLAQLVLEEVKDKFDETIWVHVSDPFDQIKVAQAILEALNKSSSKVCCLETLLNTIKETLTGKTFFFVLDDVWLEDRKMWEPFQCMLQSGIPGSRILVTTRKRDVAKQVMDCAYIHELGRLSDSDSWLVLKQRAFHGRNSSDCEMLKDVGIEIAKKCNGMPLAATIIGSLLCFKTSLEEWNNVLENEWWDKMSEGVFPFLSLSYDELDPAVKRCFAFCAIFRKGELIRVDSLIRIWMAQGFLTTTGRITMEQKGRDYFNKLAACSFFQDLYSDEINQDKITSFTMHDVVHGFAQSLTKSECFVGEDQFDDGVSCQNIRHLNLKDDDECGPTALLRVSKEKLHSLLLHTYKNPSDFFIQLKRIKWLSLYNCNVMDIPEEIGNLVHLRLLDLSRNGSINELPRAICELYNLQTLDISYCRGLSGLPEMVEKLTNLRHLLNESTNKYFKYPQGFEKLAGLQTLQTYSCNKLGYLKDMNQLRDSLTIRAMELSELEAEQACINKKEFIQKLTLKARSQVIEALQPPPNLQVLDLRSQISPSWLTDKLPNLRKLTLKFSSTIDRPLSLPCLGKLPLLEYLYITKMNDMERIGNEFLGIDVLTTHVVSFPKLERLEFSYCDCWEEWEDISEEEKK